MSPTELCCTAKNINLKKFVIKTKVLRNNITQYLDDFVNDKEKIHESFKFFNDPNKSQIVMKENPRKSPRHPPNSAKNDSQG